MSDPDKAAITYFHMGQWPVYLGFTASPKAFRKEMKRLKIAAPINFTATSHANATTHFLEKDGNLTAIITMQKPGDRSYEQVAGLVAHEAMHVVQEMWSHLGEREPGKEAEAYLIQYITQSCLQVAFDTGRTRKEAP